MPAVAVKTSASMARVLPRLAWAKTAKRNRNQKAETEGVRYRNAASATKSTTMGMRKRLSLRKRSARAAPRAISKYTARKATDAVRTDSPEVSSSVTRDKATRITRPRVTWRSR